MSFFITENVTVRLDQVVALSRSGITLKIHLYNKQVIDSQPGTDWELETYTSLWEELIAAEEAEQLARHTRYMQASNPEGCLGSKSLNAKADPGTPSIAESNEPPKTSQTQNQN